MELLAEYNYKPYRTSKGNNILVEVLKISDTHAEIKEAHFKSKHVSLSKLKPYLDPDADGSQWLFLGHTICEQVHPNLIRFAIYESGENSFVRVTPEFSEAKKIIINKILETGEGRKDGKHKETK